MKTILNKIKNKFFPFYKSRPILEILGPLIQTKKTTSNEESLRFVGGCVRKFLEGKEIDDIDVATIYKPEEIIEIFKDTDVKVIPTGLSHGSLTLIKDKTKIEITTLRLDKSTDGRHAEIEHTDNWYEDSRRRDFTINSIYLSLNGSIFDPHQGLQDLKNSKIKFIGKPEERIEEDYLRIIRYLRFATEYNFNLSDCDFLNVLKVKLNGLNQISRERIFVELNKMIQLDQFINKLKADKKFQEIFCVIFPEFKNIEKLDLLKEFDNELDLSLSKENLLYILLYDGKDNVQYFCHKYKVSNKLQDYFNNLNLNINNVDKKFFDFSIKKNIYHLGKELLINLLICSFFIKNNFNKKNAKKYLNNITSMKTPIFPYDGKYLKSLGYEQGKQIGSKLKELEEIWLENNFVIPKDKLNKILNLK